MTNFDNEPHTLHGDRRAVAYSDFDPAMATVRRLASTAPTRRARASRWTPGSRRRSASRLTLDPSTIDEAEQEYGWYYFHPNIDGNVKITQSGGEQSDTLHVPWHVAPLATSDNSLSKSSLDLTGGPGHHDA